jgi:protein tyrosine kinase
MQTSPRAHFRSDQFSFGVVLYEMLTGRRAFERPTIAETLSAIIRDDPAPIVQVNATVPPPVRWIVERCLAKAPDERYGLTRAIWPVISPARATTYPNCSPRADFERRRVRRRTVAFDVAGDQPLRRCAAGRPRGCDDRRAHHGADTVRHAAHHFEGIVDGYRGRTNGVPDIAEELGVEWVVLASLAKPAVRCA